MSIAPPVRSQDVLRFELHNQPPPRFVAAVSPLSRLRGRSCDCEGALACVFVFAAATGTVPGAIVLYVRDGVAVLFLCCGLVHPMSESA